jgi:enoyl-CoA hydratase/carnithine racemase
MLTGARLAADELHSLGVVNRVVPRDELDPTVAALVEELVRRPPLAVQGAKAAVRGGWGASTATGTRAAAEAQLRCLRSADFVEAGQAFVAGREPTFTGR